MKKFFKNLYIKIKQKLCRHDKMILQNKWVTDTGVIIYEWHCEKCGEDIITCLPINISHENKPEK